MCNNTANTVYYKHKLGSYKHKLGSYNLLFRECLEHYNKLVS